MAWKSDGTHTLTQKSNNQAFHTIFPSASVRFLKSLKYMPRMICVLCMHGDHLDKSPEVYMVKRGSHWTKSPPPHGLHYQNGDRASSLTNRGHEDGKSGKKNVFTHTLKIPKLEDQVSPKFLAAQRSSRLPAYSIKARHRKCTPKPPPLGPEVSAASSLRQN